ncbi:MAG: DUF5686 and carboxypeptidase regulatory-like domain-containing protein [Flavobacteriales bacterium]
MIQWSSFKWFALVILIAGCVDAIGQSAELRGLLIDENGAPIPFANVFVINTSKGSITNENGQYRFLLDPGKHSVQFSSLGYETVVTELTIKSNERKIQNATLKTTVTSLGEVEIVANTRDRAKEIMEEVRTRRSDYLSHIKTYSCETYLRVSVDRKPSYKFKGDSADLPLTEVVTFDSIHYDTVFKRVRSDMIEATSTLYVKPLGIHREVVHAYIHREKRRPLELGYVAETDFGIGYDFTGTDNMIEFPLAAEDPNILFTDNSVRINFYENMIDWPAVCQKPILSPIAATSALSYRYDYEGAIIESEKKIFKIKVTPLFKSEALFEGHIFISDSTYALHSVDLNVLPAALLRGNELSIRQRYDSVGVDAFAPTDLKIDYEIPMEDEIFYGSVAGYFKNYDLNPQWPDSLGKMEVKAFDIGAFDKDTAYWVNSRPELLEASEIRFIDESDSLMLYYVSDEYYHEIDSAFNRISIWTPLIGYGHRNRAKGTEFFVMGILGQITPFGPGGYRHSLPMQFEKEFKDSKVLEFDIIPSYGPYHKDFKMYAGVGYTYYPKKFVRTYIDGGHYYDRINQYASLEQILARNNFADVTSIGISQQMEIVNGLYGDLSFIYSDQRPISFTSHSEWERLIFGDSLDGLDFARYIKSEFRLDIQYRIRQKYFIKGNKKIVVGSDFPDLFFTYRKGVPKLFNSEVNFDYIEGGIKHDLELKRLGKSNYKILAGTYLNKASLRILEYKYFRGSDAYFFSDPTRSMQLLGVKFSTPYPFVQANYVHHFEGAILGKVPGLSRLKLQLAAGAGALYIQQSNFAHMELFAGLERVVPIFKEPFRFGVYAVTADNSIGTAQYTFKFGAAYFNTFTNKWSY